MLIDGDDHIWGIDHGLCFAAEFKLRTVIWEFGGEPIDPALLEAMPADRRRVPLEIATLLADDEVEALQERAQWVAANPAFPVDQSGRRYPWPMVVSDVDDLIHRADLDGLVRMVDTVCADAPTGRRCSSCATAVAPQLATAGSSGRRRRSPNTGSRCGRPPSGRRRCSTRTAAGSRSVRSPRWSPNGTSSPISGPHLPQSPRLRFHRPRMCAARPGRRCGHGEPAGDPVRTAIVGAGVLPRRVQRRRRHCAGTATSDRRAEFATVPADVGEVVDDPEVTLAVRQLVEPWTTSSNGRAEIAAVEGTAASAVAALGVTGARLASISPAAALAWLAWAGASGGAHGRRRGAAIGRFSAWWTVAALVDLTDAWPVQPDELGDALTSFDWYWWDAGEPRLGWELQLAVADPSEGYAWAISAHDSV